ncbi:MAG: hypothetical protein IT380_24180 [Myxococcales bacterium]|nr:hypothetical protein [Myxococcales bacterium]
MKRFRLAVLGVLLLAGAVRAWQYEDEFTLDQMGGRPGGGGNWATGGQREHKVTCVMCHVLPDAGFPSRISANVTFSPALTSAADGGSAYLRNTTYDVTVAMVGEHLGLSGTGANHNQMAASFEDGQGRYAGRLRSDTGFAKGGNCPTTLTAAHFNAYDAGSTTVTFAGCNAVVGRGRGANASGHTTWRFQWTAPDGGGPITLYYGVTDASGDEKTLGDDSVMGARVLEQGN